MGISSECYLIWRAVGPARNVRLEWGWVLQAVLAVYVPGEF